MYWSCTGLVWSCLVSLGLVSLGLVMSGQSWSGHVLVMYWVWSCTGTGYGHVRVLAMYGYGDMASTVPGHVPSVLHASTTVVVHQLTLLGRQA